MTEEEEMTDPVEAARRIVENHQYEEVDGVLLDATTANLIVTVADGLSPENRAKLEAMDVARAGTICWKLVGSGAVTAA